MKLYHFFLQIEVMVVFLSKMIYYIIVGDGSKTRLLHIVMCTPENSSVYNKTNMYTENNCVHKMMTPRIVGVWKCCKRWHTLLGLGLFAELVEDGPLPRGQVIADG